MQVRLESIELNNFKNVQYGKIRMPSDIRKDKAESLADIVGIYGQNGSGKTAVIDTLSLLKTLMSGEPLPPNATDYITKTAQCATLICGFSVKNDICEYEVKYKLVLELSEGVNSSPIASENIVLWQVNDKKQRIDSMEYDLKTDGESSPLPKKRWAAVYKKLRIDMEVEKRMCVREHRSALFSAAMNALIFSEDNSELKSIITALSEFAKKGLYIVKADSRGVMSNSMDFVIPATTYSDTDAYVVKLTEPTVMPSDKYTGFCKMLDSLNTVMNVIIPGLTVKPHEFGREIMRDGKEGMRFELMSKRGSVLVPLRYESEGIKKIISIINLIIAMYNCYSMCIVVDEMDAGVFEFLLGELLSCIEEGGKGQLIFTSHNLRPLEMISNENLVFTTTNPQNRYIRITGKAGNLRNEYLRHIMLGGLREEVYESVNTFEIASAFRKCRTE